MTDAALPLPARPAGTATGRQWLRLLAYLTRPMRHARRKYKQPTAEELAALARAKQVQAEQRALAKRLDELARDYKRLLLNALTRVGVSYMYMQEGKRRFSKVQFEKPALVSPEAIYYRVRTDRLPYHVSIAELLRDENVMTLCAATNRPVHVLWDKNTPERGCVIMVELKQGVRGIPRHVDYSEMLNAIKEDDHGLTVPIGVGMAGQPEYNRLDDMIHMLIAGATGQGKSVWLKGILLTLALRNSPSRLRFVMVDLKGGAELRQFQGLPHLHYPIIKNKKDVAPALRFVLSEVDRRLALFEKIKVVDIKGYNQRHRRQMPYLVLVIDELANLMLDKELRGESETLLADIAARARASGIHVIAATQRPSVDVITGLIKANFPTRVAFSTASQADSRVIIDTNDATQIGPRGRMIFFVGSTKKELQGPWLPPQLIDDTIEKLVSGQQAEALQARKRHNWTLTDILKYALEHHEGRVPVETIYSEIKVHGVQYRELREMLQAKDGAQVEIDGEWYLLKPPVLHAGRQQARFLVRVDEPEVQPDDVDELLSQFSQIDMTGHRDGGRPQPENSQSETDDSPADPPESGAGSENETDPDKQNVELD